MIPCDLKPGPMLFGMSRPLLESFASATDLLVRIFAILTAISALLYFFSSRQLHKIYAQESSAPRATEKQHVEPDTALLQAQAEIQELKKDNANLGLQLLQEHEARLLTQWRLGPRFVPAATQAEMIQTLEPFAGNRLNFGYFTDLETAEFGEELLEIVRAAGWKAQVFKIKSIQPVYGVECGGPNPEDPAFQALNEALKMADQRLVSEENGALPAEGLPQPQLTDQVQSWVMVGLKRPHLRKKAETDTAAPLHSGPK